MQKIKNIFFLFTIFLFSEFLLTAEPSFSAMVAGSIGVNGDVEIRGSDSDWTIPLSTFAAAQVDFAKWATLRGEIEMQALDFPFSQIFDGNDATVKIHELSLVFTKRATSFTSFFSIFLGAYEQIGSDTFLMRQFGIEPISSIILKSVSNLSGSPLYTNSGGGVSYILRVDRKSLSTGAYLYYSKDPNSKALNVDYRLAMAKQRLTLDFVAGIGLPWERSYTNENGEEVDVVMLIEDVTFHAGLNLLLGDKYGHGLLIQTSLKNFVLKGDNRFQFDDANFTFLIEPRLRFNTFGMNITAFILDKENVKSLFYLRDNIGVAVTTYFDNIETKKGLLTAGIHFILALGNTNFSQLIKWENPDEMRFDGYITPYAEIPLSSTAKFELMGQIGLCNITNIDKIAFNIKAVVGFKKQF